VPTREKRDPPRENDTREAGSDEEYLAAVGERVRSVRLRRGMTRSMLSDHSGVSERYLAQLEGGQGNVSIRLLRRIARAMDVPVADLAHDGPEQPVELTLMLEQLKRLPPEGRRAVQQLLGQRFARRRRSHIALIGVRGAGKTTLGGLLAARLGVPFVRLVGEIEREAGMAVSEILALAGQQGYRRLERRALTRVIEEYPEVVIEVGGGLATEPSTFNFLLSSCYTVWVRTTPEEHVSRVIAQGDYRLVASNREAMGDLERILATREPYYRNADVVMDTTGRAPEECAGELERLFRSYAATAN